ncbi:predicted protein [Coccidioides posadasii str. Silveira]|uniref:Predicted protein n=1 Tax=Coccidioides posadasii (strain RMSCC 757 / Silveira) TaxID=443226 RepID=E9DHX0_COCPS|nr:predicted protein [Coccidioides posadasii str. Silveira]
MSTSRVPPVVPPPEYCCITTPYSVLHSDKGVTIVYGSTSTRRLGSAGGTGTRSGVGQLPGLMGWKEDSGTGHRPHFSGLRQGPNEHWWWICQDGCALLTDEANPVSAVISVKVAIVTARNGF